MMPCGVKREQALQCPLLVLFKLGYACLEMCDLGLQVVYLPSLHALLCGYRRFLGRLRCCARAVLDGIRR